MIRTASFITTIISVLFLAVSASVASAETTVNVNTNTGGNTVCVNGKCTSSNGTSTSKVCVNGVCHTNENGDVNYQSEDGTTKVTINNDSGSSVNVQQKSEGSVDVKVNDPTATPAVAKEVQGVKDEVNAKKQEVEKKVEEVTKGFDIMKFIQAEFTEIKKFFMLEFIFGEK